MIRPLGSLFADIKPERSEPHMMTNYMLSITLLLTLTSAVISPDAVNNFLLEAELEAIRQNITLLLTKISSLHHAVDGISINVATQEAAPDTIDSLFVADNVPTNDLEDNIKWMDAAKNKDNQCDALVQSMTSLEGIVKVMSNDVSKLRKSLPQIINSTGGSSTQQAAPETLGSCCDAVDAHRIGLENNTYWTVLMRRDSSGAAQGHSASFNRTWNEYKKGFSMGADLWKGLDSMYTDINMYQPLYMRLKLVTFQDKTEYVLYTGFHMDDEKSNFRIWLGEFSGTLPNTMNNINGSSFSTYDKDNDGYPPLSCAAKQGGGWWFTSTTTCGNVWATGEIDNNLQKKHIGGIAYGRTNTSSNTYVNYKSVVLEIRPKFINQYIYDCCYNCIVKNI